MTRRVLAAFILIALLLAPVIIANPGASAGDIASATCAKHGASPATNAAIEAAIRSLAGKDTGLDYTSFVYGEPIETNKYGVALYTPPGGIPTETVMERQLSFISAAESIVEGPAL